MTVVEVESLVLISSSTASKPPAHELLEDMHLVVSLHIFFKVDVEVFFNQGRLSLKKPLNSE